MLCCCASASAARIAAYPSEISIRTTTLPPGMGCGSHSSRCTDSSRQRFGRCGRLDLRRGRHLGDSVRFCRLRADVADWQRGRLWIVRENVCDWMPAPRFARRRLCEVLRLGQGVKIVSRGTVAADTLTGNQAELRADSFRRARRAVGRVFQIKDDCLVVSDSVLLTCGYVNSFSDFDESPQVLQRPLDIPSDHAGC